MAGYSLCILGCGNLGTAILRSLLQAFNGTRSDDINENDAPNILQYIACVRSAVSEQRLASQFNDGSARARLQITTGDNKAAIEKADVVILAVDPSEAECTLSQTGVQEALKGKLLISVMAGWTRERLESFVQVEGQDRTWVIRVLPNIAALVSQGLTAVEEPAKGTPQHYIDLTTSIFSQVGRTIDIKPRTMDAFTAVGGSTPAFFAVICDAFIDAAVAVGVPRTEAQTMIYQSMKGTAEMLQSGIHPGVLKDQGTSPEGCTIGGLMVLEEAGVRGHLGKALREAVTLARLMGTHQHLNDTRRA